MNQYQALFKIVTFAVDKDDAIDFYLSCEIDTFKFSFTKDIFLHVLMLSINNEISFDELQEWACFLDCREEIMTEKYEDYLYALSNPALMNGEDMTNKSVIIMSELKREKVLEIFACLQNED